MCISSSVPTPPPPPAVVAPPAAPKETDPQVKKAKADTRRTAALAEGRNGTIMGGQLTNTPKNSTRKTLLGQ